MKRGFATTPGIQISHFDANIQRLGQGNDVNLIRLPTTTISTIL